MAREMVHVTATIAAPPAAVWQVVGDFAGAWHPLVATISAERPPGGGLIRAFTVKGEAGVYRERLVYRSDSDRVLVYDHIEGIRDAEAYRARIAVQARPDGDSEIAWRAQIEAGDGRALEIKTGTEEIFQSGLVALARHFQTRPDAPASSQFDHPVDLSREDPGSQTAPGSTPLATLALAARGHDEPRLGLTLAGMQGPLVIFLHGIGGNRRNWEAQLAALGDRCRAVALDLRGYGDSDLGATPSSISAYCADLLRVAQHFGADRFLLVGLSYGAWIATSFAMRHPERLLGLVLAGGCTGMSEADVAERQAFLEARQAPLDAGRTPADFADAVVEVLAGPKAGGATRDVLRASMAAISVATYRDAVFCFTHPTERFDLSRLTMPVLMMTGEHDRLAPPAEIGSVAQRIADQAPGATVRYETIFGAGHVCNIEEPDRFNHLVATFLEDLGP